jgi:CheY-like chemotaxis protein
LEQRVKTVLVIDDCQELLESVSMILDDAGYNVVAAIEPQRALSLCDEIKFDVILCDLCLASDPSEPYTASLSIGLDAIWKLRDKYPGVPLVAMSGLMDDGHLSSITKLGLAGALGKPFDSETLLTAIRRASEKGKSS